jgi:transcriptional regulator with XRE-family HTH domain
MARKTEITKMVDKSIAIKIHTLRLELGLSRQQLAKLINVTHQQIFKYETGTNRISAGRLFEIATALGKPISFFFDDAPKTTQERPTQHQRMTLEISRNFMKIKNPFHQCIANNLVRDLAGNR